MFCTEVGERLSGDAIREAFYDAVDDAGPGHLRLKDDPIVSYDLRHIFGTVAVRDASLTDVQAWMGHRDRTTMRYVHYVHYLRAAARRSREAHRGVHGRKRAPRTCPKPPTSGCN